MLENQDCFAGEAQTDTLLELLGDKDVAGRLRRKWSDGDKSSEEKWEDIKNELRALKSKDSPETNTVSILFSR